MSVITFWNNGKEQTGKTLSVAAVATFMAIEHNFKILVISTGYKDKTLDNCFWEDKPAKKRSLGLFGPNTAIDMEDGISGLNKIIRSNKLVPENITNYTKVIFKGRLEILQTYKGGKAGYEEIVTNYPDVITLASKFYDMVFVDLDAEMQQEIKDQIISQSDLIVASMTQRLSSVNQFLKVREEIDVLKSKKTLVLVGKYDRESKYTIKNITRYMGEKNKVLTVPYNILFFEASEEANVADLFLKLRKADQEDNNGFFLSEVKRVSENIMYRLQDLAMKKM